VTTRPGLVNFNLYAGATFSELVTLKDDFGTPIDLTGASARMQIRREIDDASPVFDLLSTGTDPAIVLGGTLGTIKFTIAPSLMADVMVDWLGEMWVHDILVTWPDDTVDRFFQGRIIAAPGVTRP
jgi:hypothetical protein